MDHKIGVEDNMRPFTGLNDCLYVDMLERIRYDDKFMYEFISTKFLVPVCFYGTILV